LGEKKFISTCAVLALKPSVACATATCCVVLTMQE